MLPGRVHRVCLSTAEPSTLGFLPRRLLPVCRRSPVGDSRPQAFLFRGSTFAAGGRDFRVVAVVVLGLFRFGGNDSAVCGRQDSSWICCSGSGKGVWLLVFCVRGQQGRDWGSLCHKRQSPSRRAAS